ncbi:uncharacterized protein LOC131995015 [Stomoxys calcitrans]|uniref:uncharacterized protein LOC131995015 n=1 Tax=Stomoxys calcitrans TaxID=35570 RepID=UPI0027E303A0|nr:uncharacterized protein LOC131995015 [Stomoxys calcitrans]
MIEVETTKEYDSTVIQKHLTVDGGQSVVHKENLQASENVKNTAKLEGTSKNDNADTKVMTTENIPNNNKNQRTPEKEKHKLQHTSNPNEEILSGRFDRRVNNYNNFRSAEFTLEASLKEKEMELLKKENELLKREQELLRKENQMLRSVDCAAEQSAAEQSAAAGISLSLVSNFISNYDGKTDGTFWVTQLRDIQKTYMLSDNMLRALFATKLIGRAQVWLHSRRNTSDENLDELFQQFCLMFGTKETKLELRRNFERRKWSYGEHFTDYCNDKIMLASKLSLDEDELVEYIVDGIPNIQIRMQMSLQQHTSTDDLLKSLANVKLSKPSTAQQTTQKNKENTEGKQPTTRVGVRCYNCNSVGHYAADCSKPRRQPGTCYACGSEEHMVSDCELNKKKNDEKMNHYNA